MVVVSSFTAGVGWKKEGKNVRIYERTKRENQRTERESEKWERRGKGKVRNNRGEGGWEVGEWGEKETWGGQLKIKN